MTARSLDPIPDPHSIAVIGASRTPGTIGYPIRDTLRCREAAPADAREG